MGNQQQNRQARRATAAQSRREAVSREHLTAALSWCNYRLLGKSTYPDVPPGPRPTWATDHAAQVASMLRDETGVDMDESRVWSILQMLGHSAPLQMKHRVQAHWFELGMPTVAMDAKLASSLMCMKVSAVVLADFRMPFDSIRIVVPPGLVFMVRRDGVLVPVTQAFFARASDDAGTQIWCLFAEDSTGDGTLHRWNAQIEKMSGCLPWDGDEDHPQMPDAYCADLEDVDRRSQDLLSILAVNVCLMMQEKRYVRETRQPHAPSARRKGPPASRHFQLTRPIVHDMRKAVVEYSKHGGKSPTVQCVVAGHWKMQPYGPGRAERKRIFIEPYWRGPEDALIALRPHVLKGSEAS